MSPENQDELREKIWDQIYYNGPQSIMQLAEFTQLSVQVVTDLVNHAWFSVGDNLVSIATVAE